MRTVFIVFAAIVVIVGALYAWLSWPPERHVRMEDWRTSTHGRSDGEKLRFAVASMVGPERTWSDYRNMVNVLARSLSEKGVLVIRPTYAEVRRLLENNEVDLAFVCTGTYVASLNRGKIELLVMPEFEDGWEYRSVVIVRKESPIQGPQDLRGRSFAFTDPESNTGCIVPTRLLVPEGESAASFFGKTTFTGSHDRSAQAVARHLVDAAGVDLLVLMSLQEESKELREQIRTVWRSDVFGPPPVVVPAALDPDTKERLQRAFLELHRNREGLELLNKLHIKRFVKPRPEVYASAIRVWGKSAKKGP